MPESLEILLSQLAKDQNLLHSVEEATKQGAVLPILNQIGFKLLVILFINSQRHTAIGLPKNL